MDQNGADRNTADHKGTILSGRVRLARNLADVPFLAAQTHEQALHVLRRAFDSVKDAGFVLYPVAQMSQVTKLSLVEKHLISIDLAKQNDGALLKKPDDDRLSVMLNEEDHIRLQCILSGTQLKEAYGFLNDLDDKMAAKLPFAFDKKLGYLTACPTNVGTGMRASVMLHLPALTISGQIGGLLKTIGKLGITVRGLYGEGSTAAGQLYQVSNQVTLGISETTILHNIEIVVRRIVELENEVRQKLAAANHAAFEDRVYRALGTLENARVLSAKELMAMASEVKMGVSAGIVDSCSHTVLDDLMVSMQTGCLQQRAQKELNSQQRDEYRALLVRQALSRK
ncbi:MAG: protein arginine kinase [Christensenellales bacterium]